MQVVIPKAPETAGQRIELRRGTVTEWYVNDERGLEQGLAIESRPPNTGTHSPLFLELTVLGSVDARVNRGERTAILMNRNGASLLKYALRTATDSQGKAIQADIEVVHNRIRIQVDDDGAVYPILVDSLIGSSNWSIHDDRPGALGFSVATAGDVNGDGFSDVIVGAPHYDNGQGDEGRVYLYLGSSSGLTTSAAWTAEGDQKGSLLGFSVATAGDVNGDGYSDIIVAAPGQQRVFVYLGSAAGLPIQPSWIATLAPSSQPSASGTQSPGTSGPPQGSGGSGTQPPGANGPPQGSGGSGTQPPGANGPPQASPTPARLTKLAVATAGDIDGDGYSEIVVGAPELDEVLVWFGGPDGLGPSGTPSNAGWSVHELIPAGFGSSVSTAGDVNGDGYGDLVVGAPNYLGAGRVYVYLGAAVPRMGSDGNWKLGGLNTSPWVVDSDQVAISFGRSVATAGDVNGDGYSDVLVGAPDCYVQQGCQGRAYLYLGSPLGLGLTPGWMAEGEPGAHLGFSVAAAGDVNGDGYADVIIGAPYGINFSENAPPLPNPFVGRLFLYLGSSGVLRASPDRTVKVDQLGTAFGFSVATAGDVNGDGYSDFVVGAPYYCGGQAYEGCVFLYLGSPDDLATTASQSMDSPGGFVFAPAGDVNGDGYGDVTVGAPYYDNGNGSKGRVYLYAGSASGLETSPAWTAEGDQVGAQFGFSVATAGDVNGDGYSDVIVSAPYYDNGNGKTGRVFLYAGSATGLAASPIWTADGDQVGAQFGYSISTAGDVNGDGYSDVIVGAPFYNKSMWVEGRAFLFLGGGNTSGLASSPAWTAEGNQIGALFGYSVATAGDVNGDGYSDVIVGAPSFDNGETDEGRAFLFLGTPKIRVEVDWSRKPYGLETSPAWTAEGDQVGAQFGFSVATAGDVNGDGYSDVIVGEPYYDGDETNEGRVSVFLGSTTGLHTKADWTAESHQSEARLGWSVATAGDINGDGFSEILVGAPYYDDYAHSANNAGRVFLWYGGPSGLGANGTPDNAGWTWGPQESYMSVGLSVAPGVDLNGDGFPEVIVASPQRGFSVFSRMERQAVVVYPTSQSTKSLGLLPSQVRIDSDRRISPLGSSDTESAFRLQVLGRSPAGRVRTRLEWEVKPLGVPFDSRNLGRSFVFIDRSGPFQVPILSMLTGTADGLKAGTPYHWRLRILSDSPFFPHSPWLSLPDRNRNETSLRTAGTTNKPPVASFTATPITGPTPLLVQFDGSASRDPDGTIIRYGWAFGDGAIAEGVATNHIYSKAGTYTVNLSVLDDGLAANTVSNIIIHVTEPNQLPIASFTAQPIAGDVPLEVNFDASASSDLEGQIVHYEWNFGDDSAAQPGTSGAPAAMVSGVIVTHTFGSPGTYAARLTVTDDKGATGTATQTITATAGGVPPEPASVASTLDRTVATDFFTATQFLFSGSNPIQTGVAPGIIEPKRAAVLRGQIRTFDGGPLSGVKITIPDHSEYGWTLSRTNGDFDIVVNGGGQVTVRYQKLGYLEVQRHTKVPWRDYAWLPDVVMVPADKQVTSIGLGAGVPLQVAKGSRVIDSSGSRQAVLVLPGGIQAELVLPDGRTQAIDKLHIRITEYTVGAKGPQAMPAELPPTSGYTYAAEFSADEIEAAGAKDVRFDRPIVDYVENFLGFSVGLRVPVGYYNRMRGAWIPSEDGRVIKVVRLSTVNGKQIAELDIDGNCESPTAPAGCDPVDDAAALAQVGITEAEREQLATLYQPGQELWRVPITHFSPWDCNWPYRPPSDAKSPSLSDFCYPNGPLLEGCAFVEDPCTRSGSIIQCQNQVFGEDVRVVGTPFNLHYQSDRVEGYQAGYTLTIPLSATDLPPSLKRIDLEILVAGRRIEQSFPAEPNQKFTFTWDGRDAYGRILAGAQPTTFRLGYVYDAVYMTPSEESQSFGAFSSGIVTTARARQEITLWRELTTTVGPWDANALRLGGWTLSVHHSYDPIARVLYMGNGRRRSASRVNNVIRTIAGRADRTPNTPLGDDGPATSASLWLAADVAVGPDGSVYIADNNDNRIRKVNPDGIITTIAGTGVGAYGGDGGPALNAALDSPFGIALASDGTLYIADTGNGRIRQVGRDGIITTIAGSSASCESDTQDGGPATSASLCLPTDVAIGPDGTIYIADMENCVVRRVGPDGIISTVAGIGFADWQRTFDGSGDGGSALAAGILHPWGVDVAPDGSLYIADTDHSRIRKVGIDGTITTVAGTGEAGYSGDYGPALSAQLNYPHAVAVGAGGSLYISDSFNHRVRFVGPDGIITPVAGNGDWGSSGDGGLAVNAKLQSVSGIATMPSGALLVTDLGFVVRAISAAFPGFTGDDIAIASGDGSAIYHFSPVGRHLRTIDAITGALIYRFNYTDYNGTQLLTEIVDRSGKVTPIEREPNGDPRAVVSPYNPPVNQRMTLGLDDDGFLQTITNPAGEIIQLSYGNGRSGLLEAFTDPRGNTFAAEYDNLGRLSKYVDPMSAGGSLTFVRTQTDDGYKVTTTTAMGRVTSYTMQALPEGGTRSLITYPSGAQKEMRFFPDGQLGERFGDGTKIDVIKGPDPRWGMQAPMTVEAKITAPSGRELRFSESRQVTLENPADPLTLRKYVATLNFNDRVYQASYDAATLQFTRTTPEGRKTIVTLNTEGRIGKIEPDPDQNLEPVNFLYYPDGRIQKAMNGDRYWLWQYGYDPVEHLVVATRSDAAQNAIQYVYDAAAHLRRTVVPSGRPYSFGYDANGNRNKVTLPTAKNHSLVYTALNLLEAYTPPDNEPYQSFKRTYTPDKEWDNAILASGRILDVIQQADGRLKRFTYPEGSTEFTYEDNTDRPTTITRIQAEGSSQHLHFGYDGDRTIRVVWEGVANGAYSYRFDNNQHLVGITRDGDGEVALPRDHDGLLVGYGPFTLSRQGPAGGTSRIYDQSMSVEIGYGSLGQIKRRTHTVNSQQIYVIDLTRNSVGKIWKKEETVGGSHHTYEYDYFADGMLKSVKRDGSTAECYQYDADQNRMLCGLALAPELTAKYDSQDRITTQLDPSSNDFTNYKFDGDGFLNERGGSKFQYSALGELLKVTLQDGQDIRYTYDALFRRVARRTIASGTYQYFYGNPGRPFELTSTIRPDGELSRYYYDEAGRLFAINRGDNWFYAATDQVGTPRVVADAVGNVVKALEYDSYGRKIFDSNPGFELPVGFAGGLADETTGLVRFGFRDYDPLVGSWMSRDPILFGGEQANLYAYAAADPVNVSDPTGLWCVEASAIDGVGGGVKICLDSDSITVCADFSAGVGASIDFDPFGEGESSGAYIRGEAEYELPLNFGIGVEGQAGVDINGCRSAYLTGHMGFGPIDVEPDIYQYGKGWFPSGTVEYSADMKELFRAADLGAEARVSWRVCKRF